MHLLSSDWDWDWDWDLGPGTWDLGIENRESQSQEMTVKSHGPPTTHHHPITFRGEGVD